MSQPRKILTDRILSAMVESLANRLAGEIDGGEPGTLTRRDYERAMEWVAMKRKARADRRLRSRRKADL